MANKPNNPSLWSKAKSMAKQKYDVYPSAYANGWASKWYKSKGGTWRKAKEGGNYYRHMFKESGNYNDCPNPPCYEDLFKVDYTNPWAGVYGNPYNKQIMVPPNTSNNSYSYNWSNPKASTPTAVHIPSGTYNTPQQIEKKKKTEERKEAFWNNVAAVDKAIGQYVVQPAIELYNTPFALFAEGVDALEGQPYNFSNALPNPTRIAFNAEGIDHLIPQQKLLADYFDIDREKNPYLAMGVDFLSPGPAMFAKPFQALSGIGKMKLPNIAKSTRFKPQVSIEKDYVKLVTSDPRYAQKAKELDIKYRGPIDDGKKVRLSTDIDNQLFEKQIRKQQESRRFGNSPEPVKPDLRGQELIDYNYGNRYLENKTRQSSDHIGGLKYLRQQRNNPYYQYDQMAPFAISKNKPMLAESDRPFLKMARFTQDPKFYENIDQVDIAGEYVDELLQSGKPYNFKEVERLERVGGDYSPIDQRIRIQKKGALPHELKHREHYLGESRAQFPKKYKQATSKNFDNTGTLDDYTEYRLRPYEQEAWLSRDLKRDMVRRGILKDPFEHIDEAKFDKWLKLDQNSPQKDAFKIFNPELIKRLNKPNFLEWANDALPMMTGVGGVGLGTYLLGKSTQQPKKEFRNGGRIKRNYNKY